MARPGKKPPYVSFQELAERQTTDDWSRSIYVTDILLDYPRFQDLDSLVRQRFVEALDDAWERVEEVDGRRTIIIRITIDKREEL